MARGTNSAASERDTSAEQQKELFRHGDQSESIGGENELKVPAQKVRYLIQFLDKRNGARSLPLEATVFQLIKLMAEAEEREAQENEQLPADQQREDLVMVMAEWDDDDEEIGISRIPLMTIKHFNQYLAEIQRRID